jgi:hypothetical protein
MIIPSTYEYPRITLLGTRVNMVRRRGGSSYPGPSAKFQGFGICALGESTFATVGLVVAAGVFVIGRRIKNVVVTV